MDNTNPISSLQQLVELLRMEMAYERETHARTLASNHYGSTIHEPDCRYPVTLGNSSYNALDQLVLPIAYEVTDDETDSDFEPGKPATLFYLTDGGAKELPYQCYVEWVGDGVMTVSLPSKSALTCL